MVEMSITAPGRSAIAGGNKRQANCCQSLLGVLTGSAKCDESGSSATGKNRSPVAYDYRDQQQRELLKIIRNSYASLSTYHLPSLQLTQPRESISDLPADTANEANRHQELADQLLAMGLYDEECRAFAARSLTTVQRTRKYSTDSRFSNDAYTWRSTHFVVVCKCAVRFWRTTLAQRTGVMFSTSFPRDLVELLYGVLIESLLKHACQSGSEIGAGDRASGVTLSS